MLASHQPGVAKVTVHVNQEVATYLNNRKRREITKLEDNTGISVQVLGSEEVFPEHLELTGHDADGKEIKLPGQ
jgi:ribonuclease E